MALKMDKPSRGEETRKKLMDDMKDEATPAMTRLSVEITEDQKTALKVSAANEKRSISEIIRELIDGHLNKST